MIASYSIAYTVSAVVALVVLRRRIGGLDGSALVASLARIVVAAVAMALVLWPVSRLVGGETGLAGIVRVAAGIIVGLVVYGGALWLTRSPISPGSRIGWVVVVAPRQPSRRCRRLAPCSSQSSAGGST